MKYCTHCGAQLYDEAVFCVNCGKAVNPDKSFTEPQIKYCSHCGSQLKEGADFCVNCGCRATPEPSNQAKSVNKDKILTMIAQVFMVMTCAEVGIIALVFIGLANLVGMVSVYSAEFFFVIFFITLAFVSLVPLAWCIPMTVYLFKSAKENKPVSMTYKICTLIFVNIVAGILLLCRKESDEF